jgi:ribokinase
MRVAVIGHVEWTTIAQVETVPLRGDVTHAEIVWEGPAGGGAVAAVQLAKLAGTCVFFTALGDDPAGRRSFSDLSSRGVDVRAAPRTAPTRTALSLVDATGERTTTTLGHRLQPAASDHLLWEALVGFDAILFISGSSDLLSRARDARIVVATSREMSTVAAAGVHVDAVVGSGRDPAERYDPSLLSRVPHSAVTTDGGEGGTFRVKGLVERKYEALPVPGPIIDTYGVGDSFAAALTYGLAEEREISDALDLAARCGAACLTGRGPFDGQLTLPGRVTV